MTHNIPNFTILSSDDWRDYELLDSGNGMKLERFGPYHLARPEAEAIWKPALPEKTWKAAHATYYPGKDESGGHWDFSRPLPDNWVVDYKGIKFRIQTSASRHVGLFPEQAVEWDWIAAQVEQAKRPCRVLNLFGYTGAASLSAARAGAQVTHVDASRKVITWGQDNQQLSGLTELPLRWLVDDAVKFVQREMRRGAVYDGIILDPPKFGRGPRGEVWEFYKLLPNLLQSCRQIMSHEAQFVILTAYAVKASAITLHQAMNEIMAGCGGQTDAGEIVLAEKSAGRFLSTSLFARWSARPF